MEKIDLNDKYIHSPNWENRNDLENFQKILRCGYLLTPEESGVKTAYYKDKIFLAAHPNGVYAKEYPEVGIACFSSTDGYQMASKGLFFILNSKIKEDYDLHPVTYKYECAVNQKIDLYKYLEGIGNAGFDIDEKLIYCYYYIKYVNGEIPASEIIEVVQERNLGLNLVMVLDSIGKSINSMALPEYNYLNCVLSADVDSLLRTGRYYDVSRMLSEENKKIELYDKYGYPIEPQARIEEVHNMYDYVKDNKMIQTGDSYFRKMDELCEVGKQIKKII